jgi:hypothetical protein
MLLWQANDLPGICPPTALASKKRKPARKPGENLDTHHSWEKREKPGHPPFSGQERFRKIMGVPDFPGFPSRISGFLDRVFRIFALFKIKYWVSTSAPMG